MVSAEPYNSVFVDMYEFNENLAVVGKFCLLGAGNEACRTNHGTKNAAHDLQLWPRAGLPQVQVHVDSYA